MRSTPLRSGFHRRLQRGLTLVELLVGMALMLLVTMATVALFTVTTSSYRTVDAGQELQDNARFAFEIIGQAARSAGYQDRTGPSSAGTLLADIVFGPQIIDTWRVQGRNAQVITGNNSTSLGFGTTGVVNNSDALVVRFFGATMPDPANPAAPLFNGSNPVADGTMVDCSGRAIPYPIGSQGVGVSGFFVKLMSDGEPELYCMSFNPTTTIFSESQIIRGVETFQVLYGVDTSVPADDVPDRWLSADSAWDTVASTPNWNRIVAMRVGMVLRGGPGSSQGQSATATDNDFYPLGKAFTCESATSCGTPETGLKFTAPNDGRLRRAYAATFLFRPPPR